MAVKIGNASISENGSITGKAGDQTGREVYIKNWSRHSKGWVTLRCKNVAMREYIAEAMEKACANNQIGYDQSENKTLWNNVKDKGFDPSKTTKNVETDCARLIRVCVQYAAVKAGLNITIPDFYTANLVTKLMSTGLFEKLTADKYNKQSDYLERGMLQCTKVKGHCWVILSNGSMAGTSPVADKAYALGGRVLRNGASGADVKELQKYLIQLGYDCGKWGADGDFGDGTEIAVRQFQKDHALAADGAYGPQTHKALEKALDDGDKPVNNAKTVKIVGGNCYVRTAPNTSGKQLGVARSGETFVYQGQTSETGWHMIRFKNQNGWVSGKYSELKG